MKLLTCFFTALFIMLNVGCACSQNKDEQIIVMLKDFYIAYNSVWENATSYKPDEFKEKVFYLHQKYCSIKLQSELKKYYELYSFDHDLLTNDFGGVSSERLESTLTIVRDAIKNNCYVVSYEVDFKFPSTPRIERNVIRLTITEEGGSYKIDGVW